MLINELSETLSLDGTWEFSLGDDAVWGTIEVPGCWEAQGYNKFIDGPAYYRRSFELPEGWSGRRIQVEFGAVSYACEVRLNGEKVGEHRGLWTPFAFELPSHAVNSGTNSVEVGVYKPGLDQETAKYPMRSSLAGFIPDVSTTFGGLWQDVRLRALDHGLEGLRVDSDLVTGKLRVHCQSQSFTPLKEPAWHVEVYAGENLAVREILHFTPSLKTTLQVPNHELWEPGHPALYTVQVSLMERGKPAAQISTRTGFRALSTVGDQLLLNGKPIMVRGILSWGWDPDSIAPAYTIEQARGEIRLAREMGFNLVKLCLVVPNQAYFDAADEEGMLLWEELPMWLPEVTPELRKQAPTEYAEITQLVRHHPSVAIYSLGCELNASVDARLLSELDKAVRMSVQESFQEIEEDAPCVLVCDNSGSGESYEGLDVDFADFSDYHPYYDIHFFEPLLDNWRRDWQIQRPWIFGEFCDSDTFRDLNEIIDANGGKRPWWLTTLNPVTTWRSESKAMLEYQERFDRAALTLSVEEIRRSSYAQSLVTRKYTFETLRRRNGMGGYILTGLRDTPISTSGIWDDLGRVKWTVQEYCQVNGESILCLDVGRRRRWNFGGDRPDRLDCYNFKAGERAVWYIILHTTQGKVGAGSWLRWELQDAAGKRVASGENPITAIVESGAPVEVGSISCVLPEIDNAVELRLFTTAQLQFEDGGQTMTVENNWPVFVYPVNDLPAAPDEMGIYDPSHQLETWLEVDSGVPQKPVNWLDSLPRFHPDGQHLPMLLSTVWDDDVSAYTNAGGKVLLLQQGNGPLPAKRGPFWREAIMLFYPHPVWDYFPQRGYADMQFFGLASDIAFDRRGVSELIEGLREYHPIMIRLDAREFLVSDTIFEARVGRGILLACSLRLQGGMGAQPSGLRRNVAGRAMLQALLEYLGTSTLETVADEEEHSLTWV